MFADIRRISQIYMAFICVRLPRLRNKTHCSFTVLLCRHAKIKTPTLILILPITGELIYNSSPLNFKWII